MREAIAYLMREAIALESRSQSGRPLAWREHGVSLAAVTIILEFSWHQRLIDRLWHSASGTLAGLWTWVRRAGSYKCGLRGGFFRFGVFLNASF
jgi:hypothetical protein